MTGEPESLDTVEALAARRERHNFDRLIMLSDGVFAIAITLLALDVRVPGGVADRFASLLAALEPLLSAYSLSFLVISVYWLLHRRFMASILRVDAMATMLNLLILGLVSLLPAGTRLASSASGIGPGLELYAGLVIAIGTSVACFWGYAGLIGGLVSPEVGPRSRWIGFLGVLISAPLFLLLTIGAHVPPGLVPVVLLVLFVVGWVVLQRLTREAPRQTASPAAADIVAADNAARARLDPRPVRREALGASTNGSE